MDLLNFKKIPNVPFLLSKDGKIIISEGERGRKTKITASLGGEKFATLKGIRYPLWDLMVACFSPKKERIIGAIIAKHLNIDLNTIYSILNSRNWLDVDIPDEFISQERKTQRNERRSNPKKEYGVIS